MSPTALHIGPDVRFDTIYCQAHAGRVGREAVLTGVADGSTAIVQSYACVLYSLDVARHLIGHLFLPSGSTLLFCFECRLPHSVAILMCTIPSC